MIPYKDDNTPISFPVITVMLIIVNVLIYFISSIGGMERLGRIAYEWGFVPYGFLGGETKFEQPARWLTPLSSMFLHGGILHLAFNMLFLWIFGDNVEDRLGSIRFLIFYILCGFAADFIHLLLYSGSDVPVVGASGAIAGVMGAYLVLYPHAGIRTLILLFPFIRTVRIPASFYLVFWFVMQIVSHVFDWGLESGVAFAAHIGGFVLGMLLLSMLKVDDKLISGRGYTRASGHWGW